MAHRLAVERDHARAVVPQPHAKVLCIVRELTCDLPHFPGMPQQPLNHAQLHEKFTTITKGVLGARAEKVFADFSAIEKVANMREVI